MGQGRKGVKDPTLACQECKVAVFPVCRQSRREITFIEQKVAQAAEQRGRRAMDLFSK
jgi:hypothetical protein